MPITEHVEDDLIDVAKKRKYNISAIAHGCNCFCKMGAGIAKQIANEFPKVREADKLTKPGDTKKLGNCTSTELPNGVRVFNLYTQYSFGRGSRKVNYEAVARAFERLNMHLSPEETLAIPLIGCGLAGGDEDIILTIINKVSKYNVVVVRQ